MAKNFAKRQTGGNTQEAGSNTNAASASMLGAPFHNPYTFIPFPEKVKRVLPTPLSIDEHPDERERISGILSLEIKNLSPLMSCSPKADQGENGHKMFKTLTIGNDVIVPATSIRGSLRTLMTIISGGTLGYMDENLWLTQGRDAQLGPSRIIANVPDNVFLAKVIRPGNANHPGIIELGETQLIKADELTMSIGDLDKKRLQANPAPLIYNGYEVKLSGTPVNKKSKKEGLFRGNGVELELAEHFWEDYRGRHRHSDRPELKPGDLVWLEPANADCTAITSEADIKSLQWARWGRQGKKLETLIRDHHKAVLPDSMRDDGLVDTVTNLFGQIPHKKNPKAAGPFAARIRPGNLIFFDAKQKTSKEVLAPLSAPHPGCLAFYRDADDLDQINVDSPLKGYKVYRNTIERKDNAPWRYSVQGVYVERGDLKLPAEQKVNKTAELLEEGITGKLRISFRALNEVELALLFSAISVDWKLGGGKPLGLGHCRVIGCRLIDEDGNSSEPLGRSEHGENLTLPPEQLKILDDYFQGFRSISESIKLYSASQVPVDKLRYPRAVTLNKNKTTRAGLTWFARHASPKKTLKGLETIWTDGPLQAKVGGKGQIKAQALPQIVSSNPKADLLYGYDLIDSENDTSERNQRIIKRLEPFDREKHTHEAEKAGANTSQNRQSRQEVREQRTPATSSHTITPTKDAIGAMITKEHEAKLITPDRAREFLDYMKAFGITREQSTKWAKKFDLLESIANKK